MVNAMFSRQRVKFLLNEFIKASDEVAGFVGAFDQFAAITPLGRIGQPVDIALGVVFLASDDSQWMTGETLYLTGGLR